MFEYWLFGLTNPNGYDSAPYTFTGATTDFLEVVCQVAKHYGPDVAGMFVQELLEMHEDKLDYLRVTSDWNFEFEISNIQRIDLRKVA